MKRKHPPPARGPVSVRIEVIADAASVSAQARTYAEYRVFAAVARHTARIRRARVFLRRPKNSPSEVVCTVTLALEPSGSTRIRASGAHAYEAINRAVERLGCMVEQRPPAFQVDQTIAR